jgi:hypothetical protein
MGLEYKIVCQPPTDSEFVRIRQRLPSSVSPSSEWPIYGFDVLADGIYFIDHTVDSQVASHALRVLLDSVLSGCDSVTLTEL